VERFRHGRVLLAENLITLFRVDQDWTKAHLLPLFDWGKSAEEARAVWDGFLWSPRLFWPLLIALKPQLLGTAHHHSKLSERNIRQFAAFLTYAALDLVAGYSQKEFRLAVSALPPEGIQEVARALADALASAGEQREDYWQNRVMPFWQHVWPKSLEFDLDDRMVQALARLCIAARREFPAALREILRWLQPISHPSSIVDALHASGLTTLFPSDAIKLLSGVIDTQSFISDKLEQCLTDIKNVDPELANNRQYKKLEEYHRRHRM